MVYIVEDDSNIRELEEYALRNGLKRDAVYKRLCPARNFLMHWTMFCQDALF